MSTKLQRIKTMLSELLELEMGSATSDKGIVYWDTEELEVGSALYVEDEENNRVAAEDGDYEIETKVVTVADGKVVEIKDRQENEPEVEPEQEPEAEEKAEEEKVEAEPEVENPTNEGEETDTEAIVKIREEVNELYSIIDELRKEIEELKSKPAAMSAVETLKNITKTETNSTLDKYAKAMTELNIK